LAVLSVHRRFAMEQKAVPWFRFSLKCPDQEKLIKAPSMDMYVRD
jgi:hypothetical protein